MEGKVLCRPICVHGLQCPKQKRNQINGIRVTRAGKDLFFGEIKLQTDRMRFHGLFDHFSKHGDSF